MRLAAQNGPAETAPCSPAPFLPGPFIPLPALAANHPGSGAWADQNPRPVPRFFLGTPAAKKHLAKQASRWLRPSIYNGLANGPVVQLRLFHPALTFSTAASIAACSGWSAALIVCLAICRQPCLPGRQLTLKLLKSHQQIGAVAAHRRVEVFGRPSAVSALGKGAASQRRASVQPGAAASMWTVARPKSCGSCSTPTIRPSCSTGSHKQRLCPDALDKIGSQFQGGR